MRTKIYYLATLPIAAVFAAVYFFNIDDSNNKVVCQSRHTLLHDGFRLDSNFGFTLANDKGELTVHAIAAENGVQSQVGRVINFTYVKNNDVYILKNQYVEYLSTDNSKGSNVDFHFPAFFYEAGKELALKIEYDKYHNPVIYLHNMPMFYCKKYNHV